MVGSGDTALESLRGWIAQVVREEVTRALTEQRDAKPLPSGAGSYLSTRQAADLAGVSQGTVRRWIREGRLHARGAGRELRVERAELEGLLRQGRRVRSFLPQTPEEMAAEALRRMSAG